MKLFGKKDRFNEEDGDEGFDTPSPVFTQERSFGNDGGGKKRLLGIVLVLALAGAGGYYALNMLGGAPQQPAGIPAPSPVPTADMAPAATDTPMPQEGMAQNAADPFATDDLMMPDPLMPEPPMQDVALDAATGAVDAGTGDTVAGDTVAGGAADPFAMPDPAAIPADPAPVDSVPAAPAGDNAATGPDIDADIASGAFPDMAATTGVDSVAPPVDPSVDSSGMAYGPVDDGSDPFAVPESATVVPPLTQEWQADPSLAVADPDVPLEAQAAAPVLPMPEGEAIDLPLPQVSSQPVPAGAAAQAADTPVQPVTTPAEQALADNAAILNQLSAPQDAVPITAESAGTLSGPALPVETAPTMQQQGVVRPLPPQYVVVRRTHAADDVDARLTAARQALAQNRNAGASQLFEELYRDFPRDNRVLMGRALSLQKLGRVNEAMLAYEDVLINDPKNVEALTNMLGLLKGQNPGLALDKLRELRAVYPYNADVTAQLGVAYGSMGQYQDALKYLEMAEAIAPDNMNILFNKAVVYDRMGNVAQAGALYRQILRNATEGRTREQVPVEVIRNRLMTLEAAGR